MLESFIANALHGDAQFPLAPVVLEYGSNLTSEFSEDRDLLFQLTSGTPHEDFLNWGCGRQKGWLEHVLRVMYAVSGAPIHPVGESLGIEEAIRIAKDASKPMQKLNEIIKDAGGRHWASWPMFLWVKLRVNGAAFPLVLFELTDIVRNDQDGDANDRPFPLGVKLEPRAYLLAAGWEQTTPRCWSDDIAEPAVEASLRKEHGLSSEAIAELAKIKFGQFVLKPALLRGVERRLGKSKLVNFFKIPPPANAKNGVALQDLRDKAIQQMLVLGNTPSQQRVRFETNCRTCCKREVAQSEEVVINTLYTSSHVYKQEHGAGLMLWRLAGPVCKHCREGGETAIYDWNRAFRPIEDSRLDFDYALLRDARPVVCVNLTTGLFMKGGAPTEEQIQERLEKWQRLFEAAISAGGKVVWHIAIGGTSDEATLFQRHGVPHFKKAEHLCESLKIPRWQVIRNGEAVALCLDADLICLFDIGQSNLVGKRLDGLGNDTRASCTQLGQTLTKVLEQSAHPRCKASVSSALGR